MLKRFALVVHWGSFSFGNLFGLVFIGLSTSPEFNNSGMLFFLGVFTIFAFSGLGWLARFVLVGKVHFLPWKK